MLTYPEIGFTLTVLGSSLYLLCRDRVFNKPPLRLPPSPAGSYPILGHALVLPTKDEHLVYAQWCKELNSDIISLTVLGQNIIIVNSVEVARHLLDQRSTIYSSRPYLRAISDPDLLGWGDNIAIMPYGPGWKKQRSTMHGVLKSSANIHNFALFESESHGLLKRLMADPMLFDKEFRRTVAAQILSSVYGYTVKDLDDPLVRDSATVVEKFTVAAVPAMVPGAQWKRNIIQWRHLKDHVKNYPYEWAKAQIVSGCIWFCGAFDRTDSLGFRGGKPEGKMPEEEENLRRVSVSLFGVSRISHELCARHGSAPRRQARAQKEIDDVTKSERLPTMADRDSMPYIRSIVAGGPALAASTSAGGTRATSEDDEYRGYLILKALLCEWLDARLDIVILHTILTTCATESQTHGDEPDESVYKSPDQFIPDRFIGLDVRHQLHLALVVASPLLRSCPGNHYAEASLFILFASVLAVFDLGPKVNPATGQEEMPEGKVVVHALLSRILPFECTIKPRSSIHKELIESAL
ncbi:cytochrome P450 [Rhizoctonia solani]|uniref:Cytochrome P450 n=1 Tax=Rhizoctonia solani TaxID=456999 RepID=A0A8H7M5Y5_9AGAM|nr:cytochrome P450 [Rhizoctonia solani]